MAHKCHRKLKFMSSPMENQCSNNVRNAGNHNRTRTENKQRDDDNGRSYAAAYH